MRRFGGGHGHDKAGEHHDEHHHHHAEEPAFPKGHLFGEVRKPGEKRKWEDWELIWYLGMGGAFVLATIGLATKPHSKPSAWARREMYNRQDEAKAKQEAAAAAAKQ